MDDTVSVFGNKTYDETAYIAVWITTGIVVFEILWKKVQNVVDGIGTFFGGTILINIIKEVFGG